MLPKKAKARVVVKGNVQGVGYRALITQTARSLRIEGFVRNLKDGTKTSS
jgi:acylphosphatase